MQAKTKAYAHTISWKTAPGRKRALKVLAAQLDLQEGELVDRAIESKYGKDLDRVQSELSKQETRK